MTAGAIISYSWDPRVGCECYAQEQYEWGCSTREEKLGVGVAPAQGMPSLTSCSHQWPRSSDHFCWAPSGHWTRQDLGSIQAAYSGAAGHGAKRQDWTQGCSQQRVGAERASWSGQLAESGLRALALLGTSSSMRQRGWWRQTLLCRRALQWVLPCKSPPDLHTCSAPVTSSPVILAWNLKSPEPVSSKVIWILSTDFSFVGASPLLGRAFPDLPALLTSVLLFSSTRKAIISRENRVRWQPGMFVCKWLEGLQLLEIKTSPWRDGNNSICKCNRVC